jgi:hypothetical protein
MGTLIDLDVEWILYNMNTQSDNPSCLRSHIRGVWREASGEALESSKIESRT